jgi:hypothetical protein
MPKSKKPRHPKRDRMNGDYALFIPEAHREGFKHLLTNVCLIAEEKIQTGGCNLNDLAMMRDVLHLANALLGVGNHISAESKRESLDYLGARIKSFQSFYFRGTEKKDFVATLREIADIKDIFDLALDVIETEWSLEPAWCLDVYKAVLYMTCQPTSGLMTIEPKDIRKQAIKLRAAKLPMRFYL